MQYEFDQLLEDLWDGRLDEAGRQRLDALCAADPRLAARYRKEQNLTGLLSRCGPNRAPEDLARSVMSRLETRVRVRPARPWYAWVMQPAFRTAFAAVVLVGLGVEVGLLIANKPAPPTPEVPTATQMMRVESLPPVPDDLDSTAKPAPVEHTQTSKPAPARPRDIAMAKPAPLPSRTPNPEVPMPNYVTREFSNGPVVTGEIVVQPFEDRAAPPSVIASAPQATPTPAPTAAPHAAFPTVPAAKPGNKRVREDAPLSLADRTVAMHITLNPNALPLSTGGSEERTSPLPPTATTFVHPSEAKPKVEARTHKDVEMALFSVTGVSEKDVSFGPVPGEPSKWQVRARLTPAQLRSFAAVLRKTEIEPSPSLKSNSPEEAAALRNQQPSRTRNMYDITRGQQWLKPRVIMGPANGTTSSAARTMLDKADSSEKLEVVIIIEQVDAILSNR